jgi:hypothetical protein
MALPPRQIHPSERIAPPTATHIEAAHGIQAMHRRVCVPEPVCRWCLRAWPCPGVKWADQVLQRSAQARAAGHPHRH